MLDQSAPTLLVPLGPMLRMVGFAGLLLGMVFPALAQTPPSSDGGSSAPSKTKMDTPSVRIRAEEFFGVNDDDDNENIVYDSDESESPFLDSRGNAMADDDLIPVHLDLINPGGQSLEGYQIVLVGHAGVGLWTSPRKEYNLDYVRFTIGDDGVPRWSAPDGTVLVFPNRIFVEGITPGSGVTSIILLDRDEAGEN